MRHLISLFKVRNLSTRENILLIILISIILVWTSNEYMLTPQRERLETLSEEKLKKDNEIEEINNILEEEQFIKEELISMNSSVIKLGNSYFPSLDQTDLIYYVEDLFIRNNIELVSISFSEIENLVLEDGLKAQYIDINIPCEGKYENVVQALKDIKNGSLKVIIHSLYLDNIQREYLNGEVTLRVFSLGNITNLPLNKLNLKPREYDEKYMDLDLFNEKVEEEKKEYEAIDNISPEVVLNETENKKDNNLQTNKEKLVKKKVIFDFKNGDYIFTSSNEHIKGNTQLFNENKDTFLRFEFYMEENPFEENRAYVNIKNQAIKFNTPQSRLYLNTKSFNYSWGVLGIRLKTYDDQIIDLMISEGIQWLGWNNIMFSLPSNISYYPLEISHIYYEPRNKQDEINVLLFDSLECEVTEDDLISDYYIVEDNDTLASISNKIYGSDQYVKEIMENNNLYSSESLEPGKILIIKRR